jgi:ribosome-binding factor A
MAQGSRPDRVGEEIRHELAALLAREVHDPGIGFVTLTRVKVSPDLQLARVFYTMMGDKAAHAATAKALDRATPFLRRQIGARIRLRRVPEIRFEFDKSVERQDRIERILFELQAERDARAAESAGSTGSTGSTDTPGPDQQHPQNLKNEKDPN